MKTNTELLIVAAVALAISMLLIPVIKWLARQVGLVDKPNARKLHANPVPLVGGISVAITVFLVVLSSSYFMEKVQENLVWIVTSLIILITGVLDDRFDIKPSYRLVIQLACSFAIAWSGIRITSFFGLFGVAELPLVLQYGLTVIVITGVVNAYNLMDGIDGLVGGLSLIGATLLGIIALEYGQADLVVLFLAVFGAIIGFLRHNLSRDKIFMGDAGSLFLGFTFVVIGIRLLNVASASSSMDSMKVILTVAAIFLVPVLDSLRVYRGRIKKGGSPFKADRTHLHHLFLYLGITHRRATALIVMLVIAIIGVTAGLIYFIPATMVVIAGVLIFTMVAGFLALNQQVVEWKEKIKQLEKH